MALLALMIFFSHMHHLHIKTFSLVPVRSVAVFIVCVGVLRRIYKSKPNLLFGLHQLRSVFWFRVSLFKTVLGLELLFWNGWAVWYCLDKPDSSSFFCVFCHLLPWAGCLLCFTPNAGVVSSGPAIFGGMLSSLSGIGVSTWCFLRQRQWNTVVFVEKLGGWCIFSVFLWKTHDERQLFSIKCAPFCQCCQTRSAHARVVKSVDTRDLKSLARKGVPVQVRPGHHFSSVTPDTFPFKFLFCHLTAITKTLCLFCRFIPLCIFTLLISLKKCQNPICICI